MPIFVDFTLFLFTNCNLLATFALVATKFTRRNLTKKKVVKENAVLKPKKLKDGRWQVSLGIEIVDGRKINPRRQFKIRADAQDLCDAERRRKKAHGLITANADGTKVAAWMKVDARLESAGLRLSDVEDWIQLQLRLARAGAGTLHEIGSRALEDILSVQCRGTVGQCYEAWAKWLVSQKRRGRYRSNARNFCMNFIQGDFVHRVVENSADDDKADSKVEDVIKGSSIGNEEDEGWKGFGADRPMLEVTSITMKSYLQYHPGYYGVLSAWLGWATNNNWLPRNPCLGLKPEQPEQGSVVTLTNAQATKFLQAAATEKDWEVLTYLVFSLFGGIRPEEFRKVSKGSPTLDLRWEYLKEDGLEVPPELAKTRAGRIVDLDPMLIKWVDFIREKRGNELTGPMPNRGWSKTWSNWRKKHWKGKWPQDLLRHTFGSNHLARSQSLQETSRVMGNSPEVLERYYWNWRTRKKEALVYWDLSPEVVLKK